MVSASSLVLSTISGVSLVASCWRYCGTKSSPLISGMTRSCRMTVGRTSAARCDRLPRILAVVQRDVFVRRQHATNGFADDGLIIDKQDDNLLAELLLDVVGLIALS